MRQSGVGDLRFVEFLADTSLIRESREVAEQVLRDDPMLESSLNLKSWIEKQSEIEMS